MNGVGGVSTFSHRPMASFGHREVEHFPVLRDRKEEGPLPLSTRPKFRAEVGSDRPTGTRYEISRSSECTFQFIIVDETLQEFTLLNILKDPSQTQGIIFKVFIVGNSDSHCC